jgi:uncharacterized membrane protein YhaH (DUF805 family)
MEMNDAVKSVLSKYATFSGRAPRSEYWWWILAVTILMLILGLLDNFIFNPYLGLDVEESPASSPLSVIASLALLLPNLSVAVRRLHDLDKSGWWILIWFVPVIGFFLLLYWYVSKGTENDNRFGAPIVT